MKHLKGGKIRSLVAIRSKEGTVYGSVSFLAMNRKDHPPLFQVLLRFHIVAGHNRLDQDQLSLYIYIYMDYQSVLFHFLTLSEFSYVGQSLRICVQFLVVFHNIILLLLFAYAYDSYYPYSLTSRVYTSQSTMHHLSSHVLLQLVHHVVCILCILLYYQQQYPQAVRAHNQYYYQYAYQLLVVCIRLVFYIILSRMFNTPRV